MKKASGSLVGCLPDPPPAEAIKLAQSLEKRRASKVFAFIRPRAIPSELADQIYERYRGLPQVETLDILLHSPGGDIDCTYQLVKLLRGFSTKVRVLVPDYAKSAATFLCLGADEICMGKMAELGPLDAQIPDPRKSGEFMSALDAFKALEYLRQYAMETLDLTVKMVLARSTMNVNEALSEARQFVSIIMSPLYQQVRPLDLGEYSRILAVGQEYGRRVMSRYSYRNKTEDEVNNILQRIIWAYPSHGFVIDYDEAKELGLNVTLLDEQDEADASKLVALVEELVGFIGPMSELPEAVPQARK